MELEIYQSIKADVIRAGYADEIKWSENIRPPDNAADLVSQYIWICLCSGMKYTVARQIEARVFDALHNGKRIYPPVPAIFRHTGKCRAIQDAWDRRDELFAEFSKVKGDPQKTMDFIVSLPYTKGKIIRWHFAKNIGMDVAKPDRHLVRIAARYKTTPAELCRKLSIESGDRIATVDLVIWRSCEMKFGYLVVNGDLWQSDAVSASEIEEEPLDL
jgi:hypothetical protein